MRKKTAGVLTAFIFCLGKLTEYLVMVYSATECCQNVIIIYVHGVGFMSPILAVVHYNFRSSFRLFLSALCVVQ